MRSERRAIALLTSLTLIACATEPGCDVCTTSAVVYGRVTTATGTPVNGARVKVEAFKTTCGVGFVAAESSIPPLSGPDGSYRDRPLAGIAPFRACLRVTVTPPASSGLSARIVEGPEVQFRDDYPRPNPDSVRIDVSLSP
jgi:hypothetical protein